MIFHLHTSLLGLEVQNYVELEDFIQLKAFLLGQVNFCANNVKIRLSLILTNSEPFLLLDFKILSFFLVPTTK